MIGIVHIARDPTFVLIFSLNLLGARMLSSLVLKSIKHPLRAKIYPFSNRFFSIVRKSPALYAHPLPGSDGKVAISVSPDPSAVAIGTFPEIYTKTLATELETLESKLKNFEDLPEICISKPSSFNENPAFSKLLHQVLADHVEECPTVKSLAQGVNLVGETNFFNVYDFRCPPPSGRIPYVEDTLGMVSLDKNGMKHRSYEPNPMYRPVASSGILTLSDYLNDKLRVVCEKQGSLKTQPNNV
jgi:hypothetical protein